MPNMHVAQSVPPVATRLQRIIAPLFETSTYGSWAYLLTGLPIGALWFSLLVPLYITGAVLVVIWVGLGWLAATQVLARVIGRFERWLADATLGTTIPAPGPVGGQTPTARVTALLRDEYGYRVLLWSVIRLFGGLVGFILAIVCLVVPIALILAPVNFVWGPPPTWAWAFLLAPGLGIPAFFGAAHLVRALGRANAWLADRVLGPSESETARETARRAERAEEQVRIDQELHDSIGHVLTMNVVQAAAGAHVFDSDPEFAREALTNIERRGRQALDELDRIISIVRREDVARAPLPGLGDIDGLVAEARDAGVEITSRIDAGDPPAEIGRAAYRIVREALTNAARHAVGSTVRVTVTGDENRLLVEIVNGPPPGTVAPATSGSGSGLAGVHQRVSLLGGSSEAGPTPDGGFRVYAAFPIGDTP